MNEAAYREAEAELWASCGLHPAEQVIPLPRIGSRVRVQEIGDGDPVLFIHRGPNAGSTWAPMLPHFPGFRCLLVDRPGTGLSEPLPLGPDTVVELAKRFVGDVLDVSRSLIVSIRTAVHRGRVEARDGDYFGLTLSVITRILDVARGGQILVSEAAATRLSSRRRLRRLGSRRIRDLPGPVVLYELLPG